MFADFLKVNNAKFAYFHFHLYPQIKVLIHLRQNLSYQIL